MELMETVARRLQVQRAQVQAVMTLLEEGSTVPFIARYRKERTKGLDEEAIRQIQEMVHAQQKLEQRKADVLRLIDQQGSWMRRSRRLSKRAKSSRRWKTCTALISRSARPAPAWRSPGDCSRWPSISCRMGMRQI